MADSDVDTSGVNIEQIKIVMNALYLCLDHATKYIAEHNGTASAQDFKDNLLASLRHGDIDMAIMEDTKTFDFVVSRIEELKVPGN
ncbi:hypothetical protein [Enterovirga rhinocerotis]|uniref:Uncharacterized protein n=1 Tax=Enterovirga rhinocerotis TaxID=1339210 RepID=A0A4R7C4Z0_9HYPH|nr:hypothetical protein [Enterovirga rhinocerotis]TDR93093.1 hypothetical protein EV668_0346 [Enterovirga rhinocerotis]